MKEFALPTRIIYGENALSSLKTLKFQRYFLVTDPYFVQNGTAEKIRILCPEMYIFDRVRPDPSLTLVAQGVAEAQTFRPDAIIALGGGSAIDCAKGIVSMSEAALIAVPTTSGTGSEVTSFAILTHDNIKHPLVEAHLRPSVAILEPSFLQALPKKLIAEAGMDAVSHAIEALAAKNASVFSDALAAHALKILLEKLPLSYRADVSARGEIHCAATMAGIAFDHAGLGVCHALAHALGGMFHTPHGRLNGILLPTVMRVQGGYDKAAKLCGFSGTRNLIFAVERLRRSLELPETLTQAGISRASVTEKLQAICGAAANDACMKTNPKVLSESETAHIVREAL